MVTNRREEKENLKTIKSSLMHKRVQFVDNEPANEDQMGHKTKNLVSRPRFLWTIERSVWMSGVYSQYAGT